MITFYQDCIIHEVGGIDGYGKPIIGEKHYLKCRVKEKYQVVKDNAAKETVSELEFILPANAPVGTDYKIKYRNEEDEEYSKEYSIISFKITRNTIGEVVKKVVYV